VLPVDVVEQDGVPRTHSIIDRGGGRRSGNRVAMHHRFAEHTPPNRPQLFASSLRWLCAHHGLAQQPTADRTERLVIDETTAAEDGELRGHGATENHFPSRVGDAPNVEVPSQTVRIFVEAKSLVHPITMRVLSVFDSMLVHRLVSTQIGVSM